VISRRRLRFDLRWWLVRLWYRLPFVPHRGGPGLAGVREPRRPRPPTRPPMAMSAEPEGEDYRGSSVATLSPPGRRWWRQRRPRAEQA